MNTVLVIDPDHSIRQTVGYVCENCGVHCIGTPYLSEGRKIRKSQSINLIIVDLFVPEKSGFSFIDEVTAQEPHFPVIATYSPLKVPRINIENFTRMLGVSFTLKKPFGHRTLQKAIQDLVPFVCEPRPQFLSHHQYQ